MTLDLAPLLAELVTALEARPDLRDRLRALLAAPASADVEPLYLAPGQFATRLGVSRRTVFAWLAAGMPAVGSGRARRVDVRAAEAWLRERQRTDDAVERRARADVARAAARKAVGT